GISTSRLTTSGCSVSILSRASSPLCATPTSCMSGCDVMASPITRRMNAESSTTSTRIGMSGGQELLQCRQHSVGLEGLQDEVLGAGAQRLDHDGLLAHCGDHRHA